MGRTRIARLSQLTPEETITLINEVKSRRYLWDQDHKDYNNRFRSGAAWLQISSTLNMPEHITKLKWKYLRDNFFRSLKRNSDSIDYNGKWPYFKNLTFLAKAVRSESASATEYLEINDSDTEMQEPVEIRDSNSSDSDSSSSSDDDSKDSKSIDNSSIVKDVKPSKPSVNNVGSGKPDQAKPSVNKTEVQETPPPPSVLRSEEEYDLMFLESLLPYFREIEPLRKLVLRSKMQDMLINEIGIQKFKCIKEEEENLKTENNQNNGLNEQMQS